MQASEFRVGNWVNNNEEDYQITSATIAQRFAACRRRGFIPLNFN
jgi:hypothetical protein